MPVSKPVLTALGTLVLGLSLGSCIGGGTEVKTVHVPEVKTRVVEREVHAITPLPESCRAAVEQLKLVGASASTESEASGKILLVLQELGRAVATSDIQAINKSTTQVRHWKDKIGDAVISSQIDRSRLDKRMIECDTDLGND